MKKRLTFVFALMLLSVLVLAAGTVSAVTEYKPDVSEPSSGNVFTGISGSFEKVSKADVLKRVNEIRQEAYKEGLVNSYVPIKWSKGLEKIAQVRAAEASVLESHSRPSGKTIWEMNAFGTSSYAENLAWGAAALGSIELWYSEKSDLVNKTGGVTGHYESLIDPGHKFIGIGSFQRKGTWNCVCGEFSFDAGDSEDQTGEYGNCVQLIEIPASEASDYKAYGPDGSSAKKSSEKKDLPAVKILSPKAGKKSMTVRWKKVGSKKTKKIQIQYSTDKKFKKGVKTRYASVKKTSLKIKKLKSGKRYYVRIRAYTKSGSTVHVSKWSSIKKVKVK